MNTKCEYCNYLKTVDDFRLLHEGKYWQVALSSDQQYLGKSFVLLKRHAENIRALEKNEAAELFEIMQRFEFALDQAFQPTHFNWSCLMNNSARDGSPFHVHWHAIPRYDEWRLVADIEFIDQRWPQSARDMEPNTPRPDILAQIKNVILEKWRP
jgi:ATP adenylyltransferase